MSPEKIGKRTAEIMIAAAILYFFAHGLVWIFRVLTGGV